MPTKPGPPSAAQSKMARGVLEWSVRSAARMAGIAPNTIVRIEMNRPVRPESLARLRAAFEVRGCAFIRSDTVRRRRLKPRQV